MSVKHIHSVLVTTDGESKSGKTTFISNVEAEASYQTGIVPGILDELAFRNITDISAGNVFRAATYYAKIRQADGHRVQAFSEADVDRLRELLAQDGVLEHLQTDESIEKQVSKVAQMSGAQALCGTIFCDMIREAYHADGGSNLVIADARDPIGHLRRNNSLGISRNMIDPASILPVYIDTPEEVAAQRMKGDYTENLANVRRRRVWDTERPELPVIRPNVLEEDFNRWSTQFYDLRPGREIITPLLFDNGENTDLEDVKFMAGGIAMAASDVAVYLQQMKQVIPGPYNIHRFTTLKTYSQ